MEVTAQNFDEALILFRETASEADFFSIDTEFSGNSVIAEDKGHDFDTVEDRYQKLRYTTKHFLAF